MADAEILEKINKALAVSAEAGEASPARAPGTGPKSLSIKHHEIMDFLMANPSWKMGEVAKHFGVTQPWLSQIVHSDAFQNLLREKQGIAFHETVLPLREKMLVVGHQALDRMMERLPMETEVSVIGKTMEGILDRLGFGTKTGPGVVINNTQVNVRRGDIEEARKTMLERKSPRTEVITDGETTVLALPRAAEAVLGEGLPDLGEAHQEPPVQPLQASHG